MSSSDEGSDKERAASESDAADDGEIAKIEDSEAEKAEKDEATEKVGDQSEPERAPSLTPEEKREHARADYEVEVTIESESTFYKGFTENISAGGLFVATYDVRDLGSEISVEMTLPGRNEPIKVRGEVRWTRELNPLHPETIPGMGIRFLEVDDEAISDIESFIRRKEPLFFDDE